MKTGRSYCHGILCLKSYRKYKCSVCGVWLCGECVKRVKDKNYCPDCMPFDYFNFLYKKLFDKEDSNNVSDCTHIAPK